MQNFRTAKIEEIRERFFAALCRFFILKYPWGQKNFQLLQIGSIQKIIN
jgi:hypothetical protein